MEALEAHRSPDGERTIEVVGKIELHDVGYSYGAGGEPAIHGISFAIEPGEAVGIIGPSGGGKTTLTQVLLRLREPTGGLITANGVPYGDITEASWRELVALVPQEPRLFRGSIADNIRFFRSEITDDSLVQATSAAHILDEIRRLPEGFDTQLGPRARASLADSGNESPSREPWWRTHGCSCSTNPPARSIDTPRSDSRRPSCSSEEPSRW